MVKKTIVLITNIPFLLGENTARAEHEPFVHVVVHPGHFPRLRLDRFTEVAGIRDTREAGKEIIKHREAAKRGAILPEYVVVFPPAEISHIKVIILK